MFFFLEISAPSTCQPKQPAINRRPFLLHLNCVVFPILTCLPAPTPQMCIDPIESRSERKSISECVVLGPNTTHSLFSQQQTLSSTVELLITTRYPNPEKQQCQPMRWATHPKAAASLVSTHPRVAASLVSTHPKVATSLVATHPGVAVSLVSTHPKVATSLVATHPGVAASLVSTHPKLLASLVATYPGVAGPSSGLCPC